MFKDVVRFGGRELHSTAPNYSDFTIVTNVVTLLLLEINEPLHQGFRCSGYTLAISIVIEYDLR